MSCVCLYVYVLCFCHKCDTPQYLSLMKSDLPKTFSVFQDWLEWKLLRRVQCILTVLPQYVQSCEHNVHQHACTILYLSIAFKQCRICRWWRKLKLLKSVQYILSRIFFQFEHNFKYSHFVFLGLDVLMLKA